MSSAVADRPNVAPRSNTVGSVLPPVTGSDSPRSSNDVASSNTAKTLMLSAISGLLDSARARMHRGIRPSITVQIGESAFPLYRGVHVTKPFYVRIDPDDEGFIATSAISLVYETGETWQESMRNYISALAEHFEWLSEEEETLSPSIHSELAHLREYLGLEK